MFLDVLRLYGMHSPSDSERSSFSGDPDRAGLMVGKCDSLNGLEASPDGTERMDGGG